MCFSCRAERSRIVVVFIFTGFIQCFFSAPLRSKTKSGSFCGAFGAARSSCCLRVNLQVTIPSTFIWNSSRCPLLRPATSAFMQKHYKSDHRNQRRLPNEAARHCSSSLLSAERRGSMLINEPRSGTQQEWAAIICSSGLLGISEWRSQGRQSALITVKEQTFDLCAACLCPLFVSLRKRANPAETSSSMFAFFSGSGYHCGFINMQHPVWQQLC